MVSFCYELVCVFVYAQTGMPHSLFLILIFQRLNKTNSKSIVHQGFRLNLGKKSKIIILESLLTTFELLQNYLRQQSQSKSLTHMQCRINCLLQVALVIRLFFLKSKYRVFQGGDLSKFLIHTVEMSAQFIYFAEKQSFMTIS